MSKTLKEKTIAALVWSFVDRFGQQTLYILSGFILARIISPTEYGKITILTFFIYFSNILSDGGLSGALLKKKNPSEADYSTVFFFNILISLFFYAIVFFGAPLVANFYEDPELTPLLRVLQLASIAGALGFVQQTLLSKNINLKSLAKANITALLLASTIAVILALNGYKAWALVAQTLGIASFRTIVFWLFGRWRPVWIFRLSSLKEFFGFSLKMVGVSLLNSISNNVYALLIGKFYSKSQVGYYGQAYKYQDIPSGLISGTFHGVTLPVLASVNHDRERMERIFRKNIRSMAFLVFPAMFLLAIIAKPVIVLLLSDIWLPSVPIFQVLCIASAFMSFTVVACDLFIATSRSGWYLTYEIIRKSFLFTGIFFCYSYGIMALCYLWLAYSLVSVVVISFFMKKMISYGLRKFIADTGSYLATTLLLSIAVFFVGYLFDNMYVTMVSQTSVFAAIYLLVCKWMNVDIFEELTTVIEKNKL